MQFHEPILNRAITYQTAKNTVIYPDGTQTVVEALKAFEIAVNNRDAIFSVPNNQAMETLLRAVADAVGT